MRVEGDVRAWVEMRDSYWGHFQRHQASREIKAESHIVRTDPVTSTDWTRVTGRITAQVDGGLSMVFLAMEGKGRAYFSELQVKRI